MSKPETPEVDLSGEQKRQRKLLGIIAIAWSFIIFRLLDTFVVWDMVFKNVLPRVLQPVAFIATVFVGLPLSFFFYDKLVKQKK